MWLPIGPGLRGTSGGPGYVAMRRARSTTAPADGEFSNPFSIGPAIKFGMLYGAVLIGSKALSMYLGDTGVYVGAIVSGPGRRRRDHVVDGRARRGHGEVSDGTAANVIVLAADRTWW